MSQLHSPSSPPSRSKIKQKTGHLPRSISQTTVTWCSLHILETKGETNIYWALLNVEHGILLIIPHKLDYVKFPRILVIESTEVRIDPTFLANSRSISHGNIVILRGTITTFSGFMYCLLHRIVIRINETKYAHNQNHVIFFFSHTTLHAGF